MYIHIYVLIWILFLIDSTALEGRFQGTIWIRVICRGKAIRQCTGPLGVPRLNAFLGIEPWLGGVGPCQWNGDTAGLCLAVGVG